MPDQAQCISDESLQGDIATLTPAQRMWLETPCDICDDGGVDFADDIVVGPYYHRSCVVERQRNGNNMREIVGLANTLRLGISL